MALGTENVASWNMLHILVPLLVTIWMFWSSRKPQNYPPGPPRLPVIGSLPYIFPTWPIDVLKMNQFLAGKFGKIMGFYLGGKSVVVVSDYELIKEVMKKDETNCRPSSIPWNLARPGGGQRWDGRAPGILLSHGPEWVEQRRFTLKQLREFGFGKSSMEDMVNEAVDKLLESYSQTLNQPMEVNLTVNVSVISALWRIVVGESFEDLDHPKLRKIVIAIDESLKMNGPLNPVTALLPHPAMSKWPILKHLTGFSMSTNFVGNVLDLVNPYIEEHVKTFDSNHMRDFLDVYLAHIGSTQDPSSSFYGSRGMDSLQNVLLELFVAGTDTTSSSLVWAILLMAHHPQIQDEVYEELVHVFGQEGRPTLERKDQVPITNAAILECFRKTSLGHILIPHGSLQDFDLAGYTIPKHSRIVPNAYHIHHDPTYWRDPESFDPSRFLNSDKSQFVSDERVMVFGTGKRYCPGQSLAEKQFFLFFAGLMKRFRFEPVSAETPLPSFGMNNGAVTVGLSRNCPDYQVVIRQRQ
uniref:Cytochrome P450 CYP3075C1 n=1 Tax=Tigriopus kingsejongensis TaxID=1133412 RepID=A0A2H4FYU2_9MAXI|nr:cytochrome P450 CYP3075C1 [Tigriopus kingsejongensis]